AAAPARRQLPPARPHLLLFVCPVFLLRLRALRPRAISGTASPDRARRPLHARRAAGTASRHPTENASTAESPGRGPAPDPFSGGRNRLPAAAHRSWRADRTHLLPLREDPGMIERAWRCFRRWC